MDASSSLAALLHDWRDFFELVGTASATLVGLLFVAASIGSGRFTDEHRAPLNVFLTPTLAHFAAAMFACMMVCAPLHEWRSVGGLLGAVGLAGFAYSATIFVDLSIRRKFKAELSDRLFYALFPMAGHLVLTVGAALLFFQSEVGIEVVAAGLMSLLVAGVRNAWDITMFIAIKMPPNGASAP
jgi:hypothetical protein